MSESDKPPSATLLDGFLTVEDLAEELGVSPRTLSRWHHNRMGPPRVKVGNLVVYRVEGVREWLKTIEQYPVRWPNGDVAHITPQRHRIAKKSI